MLLYAPSALENSKRVISSPSSGSASKKSVRVPDRTTWPKASPQQSTLHSLGPGNTSPGPEEGDSLPNVPKDSSGVEVAGDALVGVSGDCPGVRIEVGSLDVLLDIVSGVEAVKEGGEDDRAELDLSVCSDKVEAIDGKGEGKEEAGASLGVLSQKGASGFTA